jgi:hypothetical protein
VGFAFNLRNIKIICSGTLASEKFKNLQQPFFSYFYPNASKYIGVGSLHLSSGRCCLSHDRDEQAILLSQFADFYCNVARAAKLARHFSCAARFGMRVACVRFHQAVSSLVV